MVKSEYSCFLKMLFFNAETLQKEFAAITHEIDVKQQLVNELESMQRRITSMQRHYEEKLKLMAETIRATELERDKVLKSLGTKVFHVDFEYLRVVFACKFHCYNQQIFENFKQNRWKFLQMHNFPFFIFLFFKKTLFFKSLL